MKSGGGCSLGSGCSKGKFPWINLYPVYSTVCFVSTNPLNSDLSVG